MQGEVTGQVSGETIETMLDQVMSVFRRQIEQSLQAGGIEDVSTGEWYSAETFASVIETVEDNAGASTARKLGATLPETMDWTGHPASPEEALAALSDGLNSCHRGHIGDYEFEQTGDNSGTVTVDTLYPCAFDKGVLKGTAQQFGADYVTVEEVGTRCREDGAARCTYEISW